MQIFEGKTTDMIVTTDVETIGFIPHGGSHRDRSAIMHVIVNLDIGIVKGVQGEDFFRSCKEHKEDIASRFSIIECYVWKEHVHYYKLLGYPIKQLREYSINGDTAVYLWIELDG